MDINNFSDQDLIDLKTKQDEKLERYSKCYNEATERTIKYIQNIETEMNRRRKIYSNTKEFKEDYIKYNNYVD